MPWVALILWNVIRLHVKFGPGVSREISGWQQSHYQVKKMLRLIGNLEHLMKTPDGFSSKIFFTALLRPMASHPLFFLHLELTEKSRTPGTCHGGQTLRHNLWMLSLALGLKKNFMLFPLLA